MACGKDCVCRQYGMKNLLILRTAKKITQKQLASDLNLSQGSICGYECGTREPDLKTLRKLADYFGVTVDELLQHDCCKALTPEQKIEFINAIIDEAEPFEGMSDFSKKLWLDDKIMRIRGVLKDGQTPKKD